MEQEKKKHSSKKTAARSAHPQALHVEFFNGPRTYSLGFASLANLGRSPTNVERAARIARHCRNFARTQIQCGCFEAFHP